MRLDAFITVTSDLTEQRLRDASNVCLNKAVVAAAFAGLAAAYVSGGAALGAAQEAFKDVYVACMIEELSGSVSLDFPPPRSGWTDWGACRR